jgi:hypothetical protein
MPSPLFEFFEVVAEELCVDPSRVLTRDDLEVRNDEDPLLDELQEQMDSASTADAIEKAVSALEDHLKRRGSKLPFTYDPTAGRFEAVDRDFLEFVKEMRSIRSVGRRSRDFECIVAKRLSDRVSGAVHRVGHPRDSKRKREQFNDHLRELGFSRPVALLAEKDGGFDILWLLPLGAVPHRPIVSVQCKNGEFSMETADKSLGPSIRSLGQHGGLQATVHVVCVLFNDYICPETFTAKQLNFVPLGLTDLAPMISRVTLDLI